MATFRMTVSYCCTDAQAARASAAIAERSTRMATKYTVPFALLSLLTTAALAGQLGLARYDVNVERRLDPGQQTVFTYAASAATPADVRLTHPLPQGATFQVSEPQWNCDRTSDGVACTRHLAGGALFTITTTMPGDPDGRVAVGRVRLENLADPTDARSVELRILVYRTFQVTSAGDFGAGSLRAVLQDANDRCGRDAPPCKMLFAEAMRIVPSSPLPPLTACDVVIDAGGYVGAYPIRSFDKPRRVEISGENAGAANGLIIRSNCGHLYDVTIRGFDVHSFAGNGISIE